VTGPPSDGPAPPTGGIIEEMIEGNGLGAFLRARRGRLRPADVGLPAGVGLRRTPGLRREELATLAGVSIDYYTRLEQGKERRPSPAVVDALARALRLDDDERAHLHTLADHAARPPSTPPPAPTRAVRPGIRQLLEAVRPSPGFVLSRTSDILAANPEGLALLPGIREWPPRRRNTIRYLFLHPAARKLFAAWEQAARDNVAHLRTVAAADPDAADLAALVRELAERSEEFASLWRHYDVRVKRGADRKTFRHPSVGELTLTSEVLNLAHGEQRLVVYQAAPGSRDRDALTLLAMLAGGQPVGRVAPA
jgi:transcriptional regulator with XRE-family HTH domain